MEKENEIIEELKAMSLGDHLEELRSRLILIVLGLAVGLVICLFFGKYFINILTIPYDKAIVSSQKAVDTQDTQPGGGESSDKQIGTPRSLTLQTIQPAEGFIVYIKVCLFFGLLLVSPWVFWQLWAFISSGLYKKEKKFVHSVVPISAVLFTVGAVFFITIIAPLAMRFFVRFNERLSLSSNWTFQSYINMVLMLMLVFGIAFQMPIAIVFLERMGLVTIKMLAGGRKFVILGLVIVAAAATPPDPISQMALAGPLYVLFEGSLLVCRFLRRNRK